MEHTNTLFVGIDISLNKFDVEYLDIHSNILSNKKNKIFPNNPSGLSRFVDETLFIAKKHNFNRIKIGFEATNNYGFHLPFYLTEDERLKKFELLIYQINPKIIKNARKSYSEIPKTDSIDAYVIAERLKNGKLPPYTRFNPHYLSLRFLTRERYNLIMKLVSLKSRFISILFIKASGFVQNKAFSNTFGNTSINLLTQFDSMDKIIEMDIQELVNFILKNSKNKIKLPEKVAQKVKYLARESYSINRIMHDSVTYSLLILVNQIKFYKKQIKLIDKQILKTVLTFKDHYNILSSIKGIGPVLAAGIIAELGDLSDFNNQAQVAKFSGIIWRIRQSGKFKSEETELTKTGNRYLRYYLVEAAQSLVTHNPDFLPYYKKKYNESTKHHHKRALLMVARKFIRIIFKLLKNNELYQSPKKP
jgi:transposase